jgi:hypothetical protein
MNQFTDSVNLSTTLFNVLALATLRMSWFERGRCPVRCHTLDFTARDAVTAQLKNMQP